MSIKLGGLELFTVEELSKALGIQERTIREYLREGRLKGRKLANRWYVPESSLREYFEAEEGSESQEDELEELWHDEEVSVRKRSPRQSPGTVDRRPPDWILEQSAGGDQDE